MGHKVHPYGFRLGTTRTWTAKWYADKEYTDLLKEDLAIRGLVERRLSNASVSQVEIERGINHVTVTVHTAKPGIVIGKGGANVELLRKQIGALTDRKVKLEIKEIRQPELDAVLVAANIAQQLSRRIAFKKAMKQAIQRSMKAGAKGVKVAVAGRLGGSEMGRRERGNIIDVGLGAVFGMERNRDLPLLDQFVDRAFFVIEVSDEAQPSRALTRTRGSNAFLDPRKAENTFLRDLLDFVEIDFLVGTRLHAESIAFASFLIDRHDSVFCALFDSSARTCRKARRMRAVITDAGKIEVV